MARAPQRTLLFAALPLLFGCAGARVSLVEGPREYVATDYERVLERWTRTERLFVFSELENLLTATATFQSWDFRWAYVARYAQDYRLTLAERKALAATTLEESRKAHEFFVTLHGGDRRENDLSRPESAWVVRLIDDTGSETAPSSIVSLRKPTALDRAYFPSVTVHRRAFRVRFPTTTPDGLPSIAPAAKWVGLRFAGANGSVELTWKLDDPSPAAPTTP